MKAGGGSTSGLSRYLGTLVRGGLLPAKVATVLNRLPTDKLQAEGLARVREGILPLAEQTVDEMLNPPAPPPPVEAPSAPTPAQVPPESTSVADIIGPLIVCALLFFTVRGVYRHVTRWIREWEMPVPEIAEVYPIADHRLFLRWASAGKGDGYRLYYAYDRGGASAPMLGGGNRLLANAAIIDVPFQGNKEAFITITSVKDPAADSDESYPSRQVEMDLDERNTAISVEGYSGKSPPAAPPQ